MSSDHAPLRLADLQAEIERRAVIEALRRHPQWRLIDLDARMADKDRFGKRLRTVKLADLLDSPLPPIRLATELPIDLHRLAHAERQTGSQFDRIVLDIVAEAGRCVASGYVKARVGGPRWKLQNSLGRLVHTGQLERHGTTSATRYRPPDPGDS